MNSYYSRVIRRGIPCGWRSCRSILAKRVMGEIIGVPLTRGVRMGRGTSSCAAGGENGIGERRWRGKMRRKKMEPERGGRERTRGGRGMEGVGWENKKRKWGKGDLG